MTKIFTIGHSTHPKDEFLTMLRNNNVECLVDIRTYPGSRRVPQFNKEAMELWIPEAEIEYVHLKNLGGRRHNCNHNNINGWWTHPSFRSYADYALTPEFCEGFAELAKIADRKISAIMCAEVQWWKCHRRIVTDYLLATGFEVFHIMSLKSVTEARMTKSAKWTNGGLVYPCDDPIQSEFEWQ